MSLNIKSLTVNCDEATAIVSSTSNSVVPINVVRGNEYVLQMTCYDTFNGSASIFDVGDTWELYIGRTFYDTSSSSISGPVVSVTNQAYFNQVADWATVDPTLGLISARVKIASEALDDDIANRSRQSYFLQLLLTNSNGDKVMVLNSVCNVTNAVQIDPAEVSSSYYENWSTSSTETSSSSSTIMVNHSSSTSSSSSSSYIQNWTSSSLSTSSSSSSSSSSYIQLWSSSTSSSSSSSSSSYYENWSSSWGCCPSYDMTGSASTDGNYIYYGDYNNKPYFRRTSPSTLYLYFNGHINAFGWAINGVIEPTPVPTNYSGSTSQQDCPVTGAWNSGSLACGV